MENRKHSQILGNCSRNEIRNEERAMRMDQWSQRQTCLNLASVYTCKSNQLAVRMLSVRLLTNNSWKGDSLVEGAMKEQNSGETKE